LLELVIGSIAGKRLSRAGISSGKTPVFVVGCQRSGTTMFLRVLNRSPSVAVFEETNARAYSEGWRLRSDDHLRYLIHRTNTNIVAFKPLNDAQRVDRLLASHLDSKAIWIYRDYADVANSMVAMWGGAQIDHIRQIARGRFSDPGSAALGERINATHAKFIKELGESRLSAFDAAAAVWLLRNSIFFDLELQKRTDVLLFNYEDAVSYPERCFSRVFRFLGADSTPDSYGEIVPTSVGKHEAPAIAPLIRTACDRLKQRLDACYGGQVDEFPSP
jgi:hypothetical protein